MKFVSAENTIIHKPQNVKVIYLSNTNNLFLFKYMQVCDPKCEICPYDDKPDICELCSST